MNSTIKNRITVFAFFALTVLPTMLIAQSVQLNWIGKAPKLKTGVSWGVPFEKGKVMKSQLFELNGKQQFPLQTWPLAYWPDGTIKWLGCAAVVDGQERLSLNAVTKATNQTGITVKKLAESIEVNTGVLICEINTKGNVLVKSMKIDGKTVSENGRLVCTLENRDKEADQLIQYNDFQSEVKDAVVEQSGPIRTVVKISGVHTSMKIGREILPFTVRLYFYAGQKSVRMVHTFVYDADQQKDFIKALGIRFDVPLRESLHNRHVRFSGENGGLWNESVKPLIGRYPFTFNGDKGLPEKQFAGERLPEITSSDEKALDFYTNFPAWDDYKLTQLNSNGFSISKRTNDKSSWLFVDEGKQASGFGLIGDVSGGLGVSLKNFWQSYPAALEVNHARSSKAQLTVWLWSKEAEAMDLRHYDTIPHDLNATYEDVQPGLSTPYGVARTSELTLFPYENLPSKYQTVEMAKCGEETPQLICTPEYLHAVKAFGMWSLPDYSNDTKRWVESQLDSTIFYYQKAIAERHWYGFWNYGDVMHTYDAVRHVWRYDIGGFAWDNTELAPNNWLWYSFLRTGRADIFRMAEAMTRHTGEVDCYHLGEMKGLGSRHNVSHWGCGSKEARIGQAAWKRYYYYLTTDDRCGDLMHEALEAEKALVKFEPLRVAQPREKFPYNAPMRLRWGPDWLALAGNWMTEWERTGDTRYRDKIKAGLESLAKLPDNLFTGPNGLCYDPATGRLWYDGKPNVTNQNHLATIMGGYEILLEMFDMVDCPAFRKVFTDYCKFYSMSGNDTERTQKTANWGDINFRTPRLTAFAAKELKDDKLAARAWDEFLGGWSKKSREPKGQRNIYGSKVVEAPDVLNPIHENPQVGTNGTAQWGLNAIMMLELIGDKIPDQKTAEEKKLFNEVEKLDWKPVFADNFKQPWTQNWFLDGEKAQLKNSKTGLLFKAGIVPASDADHVVLWTKQSFEGDLRIEFDFTKVDTITKFVNILYLFAEGSGVGAYSKDISKWSDLRTIPAMKTYFEHMNAFHISFSAFENDNTNPNADYIRARYYLPERGRGLVGTDLKPDYLRTGLFKTGMPHHITVICKGDDIFMQIKNAEREYLCRWETSKFPTLTSGRIGLRLMGSRVSEFANFKVSYLSAKIDSLNEIKKYKEQQLNEINKLNRIVISDDFSDNSNNWKLVNSTEFKVNVDSGRLHIEKLKKNFDSRGCLWYRRNIEKFNTANDFSISFDASIVSSDDIFESIDFQWGNINESSFYQLMMSSDGVIKLDKFNVELQSRWSTVDSQRVQDLLDKRKINHIRICQLGNRCIVYVNNREVLNTTIEIILGSDIGVQGCMKVAWNMDNLVIKQP